MQPYSLFVLDPAAPEKGWQPAEGIFDSYKDRWFWRPVAEPYMSDVLDDVQAVAESIAADAKVGVRVVDSAGVAVFEKLP